MSVVTKTIIAMLSLLTPIILVPIGHASVFTGAGTFAQTGVSGVTISLVDGILIIHETFGLSFTGAFAGTTTGTVTIIINLSTGTGTFFGQNTFTGAVTTEASTVSGTIQAPFSATFVGSAFTGRYSLFGGTGGLTNVEGQGTIQGTLGPPISGTYSGFFTPT